MKVLVAEDDRFTREGLVEVLQGEGYDVVAAENGAVAVREFTIKQPDLVCLDIMMPEKSGYDACKAIRETNPDVPILFISAKSDEIDKLVGFELGADDFITKPFSVREVIARIRAITRRCYANADKQPPANFTMADLEIAPAELRARRGEEVIELSLRDVRILQLLHDHSGQAMDRRRLFRHGWGEDFFPNSRTLDQHVSQLRKRIEVDSKTPVIIRTVHGVGYRYDA
jgi:DNA-binding response OmpR family regulator